MAPASPFTAAKHVLGSTLPLCRRFKLELQEPPAKRFHGMAGPAQKLLQTGACRGVLRPCISCDCKKYDAWSHANMYVCFAENLSQQAYMIMAVTNMGRMSKPLSAAWP